MHDEWMSDELEAKAAMEAALDARLVQALEARPEIVIGEDFAARVASQVTPRKAIALTPRHYGRNMIFVCVVTLAIAMVGISAVGAYGTPLMKIVNWVLCAQFIGLVAWLGLRRSRMES
jgi:hypothetical protein